jgi:hypothetical protein
MPTPLPFFSQLSYGRISKIASISCNVEPDGVVSVKKYGIEG